MNQFKHPVDPPMWFDHDALDQVIYVQLYSFDWKNCDFRAKLHFAFYRIYLEGNTKRYARRFHQKADIELEVSRHNAISSLPLFRYEGTTVYEAMDAFEVEVLPYIRDYARALLDKVT